MTDKREWGRLVVSEEAADTAAELVHAFSTPRSAAAVGIVRALKPAPEGEAVPYVEWWTDPRAIEATAKAMVRTDVSGVGESVLADAAAAREWNACSERGRRYWIEEASFSLRAAARALGLVKEEG